MDGWRLVEELDIMRAWDPDAVVDALNLEAEELVDCFLDQAIKWIEDNRE